MDCDVGAVCVFYIFIICPKIEPHILDHLALVIGVDVCATIINTFDVTMLVCIRSFN